MLSVPICGISGKCPFLPRISRIFTDLVTCYPCSFVASVGNIFSPTDFTDFHGFGYMLSVPICGISEKCSFLPRISQISTDLVTCYPCPFVASVGNVLFSHGFSQIYTDLATCYPCPFVVSVGNIFLPQICFLGSRQCVRDWSGILLERSGKRYSGKPDGVAGTPSFLKYRV